MKTRKTSTTLIVLVVTLLLVGSTIVAVSQRSQPPVTRVPICVKGNGQLRMVTDRNTACGPGERQMDWVVGGEVTDIRLGQGLVGRREDGAFNLALAPEIIEGCTGCSGGRIFAGFNDGPRPVPQIGGPTEIARLELPPGDYAIFAKLVVSVQDVDGQNFTKKEFVSCRLSAESDFDRSSTLLEEQDDRNIQASTNDEVVLALEVVHRFAEPGEAVLSCEKGLFTGDVPMEFKNLKLIAIEGKNISNVYLGGDN